MVEPFFVKECDLAVISTGVSAHTLVSMRDKISQIPPSSLYYHFWGRHFRPAFDHPELHNDFARWAYLYLHDKTLSEQLGIIDPTHLNLEQLREAILAVIDRRLGEVSERTECYPRENQLHFLSSIIVVFKTPITINHPTELKTILPTITLTSMFYHFIDARRRTAKEIDDFSTWLDGEGPDYKELLMKIQHIDPFFLSLQEQKNKLIELVNHYVT